MSDLETVSAQGFEQNVLNSERPVLVDFYANWCGPCNIQEPILESFSSQYEGKVDFVKVDVDTSADLLKTYGIRSIPTLILFDKGKKIATHIGVSDRQALTQLLASVA